MSATYAFTPADRSLRRSLPRHADSLDVDRDRSTLERLAAGLPDARVLGFAARWWDGAAQVPCLLVRLGPRRYRVVETCGQVVVVDALAWRARRALSSWRTGRAPLPALERVSDASAEIDVRTCTHPGCGGVRLITSADPRCPVCRRS